MDELINSLNRLEAVVVYCSTSTGWSVASRGRHDGESGGRDPVDARVQCPVHKEFYHTPKAVFG
jgi:hypothetical protein